MQVARLFVLACLGTILVSACGRNENAAEAPAAADAAPAAGSAAAADASAADTAVPATEPGSPAMGLQKIDLEPGAGAEIQSGQNALVHYTGWLYEAAAPDNKGKKFDSSLDRNQPFEFPVGGGFVIPGWDQGVVGMKVGGKRRLVIPPDLGYGMRGTPNGEIPPGATLVFDVELVEIR